MQKIFVPLATIFFAVILRLVPHPPNVAPITAMALFGGVYISKRFALLIPLTAMLLSDFVLGFHDTMIFVYGSFLLSGLIGIWLKNRKTFQSVLLGTFCASLLFFLITNFGVWLVTDLYPKTWQGLMEAYIMGIPFYRSTLLGDMVYTGLFFAAYEVILHFNYANLHQNRR